VLQVDDSADTAAARIPAVPGPLTPIGRIDVVHLGGAPRVRDESIRNALSVKPGDLFRRRDVARSQRALYESGLFRSALIDTAVATQPGSGQTVCASQAAAAPTLAPDTARAAGPAAAATAADSVKNLVVCVLEAPLREARTSVGFTTSDFLQVDGRFTHNYFLGGARRFNVQATVGNLASRGFYQALPQNVFQNPFKRVGGGTESRSSSHVLRRRRRWTSATWGRRATRSASACSRRAACRRACSSTRAGRERVVHAPRRDRAAGEPRLPLRAQQGAGGRRVLLRQLRRVRPATIAP
jgi:outer membrane translocation and assembly module TamA